jgi:hypothetical protein
MPGCSRCGPGWLRSAPAGGAVPGPPCGHDRGTVRACGGTLRRSSCSDRSHTRRHRPRTAPSRLPGPIKIILEFDGHLLCHRGLLATLGLSAPYKINCNGRGYPRRRQPPQRMHPPGRPRSAQQRTSQRRAPSVPIASENRLVVSDGLATTIKVTSSATWRCPLAGRRWATASGQVLRPIYRACLRDVPRDLLLPIPGSRQRTGSLWLQPAEGWGPGYAM